MRNISYLMDLRTDEASDRSKRSDALNRSMISKSLRNSSYLLMSFIYFGLAQKIP